MSIQAEILQEKYFSLSEKLTIIQELIEELAPQSTLKVIVNDDPMLSQQSKYLSSKAFLQQGNVVYTYELVGSKSLRKTQNNNLLQKLEAMEKNQQQTRPLKKLKDHSFNTAYDEEPQQQKDNAKPSEDTQKAIYRYFTENVKCFRCKKTGHHDYACLDEYSCNYCLSSQHHSEKCPQKIVCFRCYKTGHMVNECPYKQEGLFCHNCKRKHFEKCGFLLKGTQQVKQMFIMDNLYFSEEIRCLKCFKYGHFNCQISQGTGNNYKRPYQPMNDRKDSRDKFYNNNPYKRNKY